MKRAAIKDHENLLKVFAILLDYGVIRRNDIAEWADSVLAREEESEYAFIEFSTVTNWYDVVQLLNKNSADADSEITSRALLGVLYHLLQDEKVVLKTVFEITTYISYEEQLTSDEKFLLYSLDEYIELNMNKAYERFKNNFTDFLSIYKGFTLENHNLWPSINEEIKKDLDIRLEAIKKNYPY